VGFVVGYCFGVCDLSENWARGGGDRPIVETSARVLRDSVGENRAVEWA
jgi:hypothetical protein